MNAKRLLSVIRWNFIDTRRALVRETIGLILAPFAIIAANSISDWTDRTQTPENLQTAAIIVWIAMAFLMVYWTSKFCYNMKTKNAAVNYLMLPATSGEKYLANMFQQTVVRVVEAVTAIIGADILQMVISVAVDGPAISFTVVMMQPFAEAAKLDIELFFFLVAMIVLGHSLFVLGGCFFKRNQLVFTGLVMFIVSSLLIGAVAGCSYLLDEWADAAGLVIYIRPTLSASTLSWIGNAVIMLFAAWFYWLSFRLFSRRQVITGRLIV